MAACASLRRSAAPGRPACSTSSAPFARTQRAASCRSSGTPARATMTSSSPAAWTGSSASGTHPPETWCSRSRRSLTASPTPRASGRSLCSATRPSFQATPRDTSTSGTPLTPAWASSSRAFTNTARTSPRWSPLVTRLPFSALALTPALRCCATSRATRLRAALTSGCTRTRTGRTPTMCAAWPSPTTASSLCLAGTTRSSPTFRSRASRARVLSKCRRFCTGHSCTWPTRAPRCSCSTVSTSSCGARVRKSSFSPCASTSALPSARHLSRPTGPCSPAAMTTASRCFSSATARSAMTRRPTTTTQATTRRSLPSSLCGFASMTNPTRWPAVRCRWRCASALLRAKCLPAPPRRGRLPSCAFLVGAFAGPRRSRTSRRPASRSSARSLAKRPATPLPTATMMMTARTRTSRCVATSRTSPSGATAPWPCSTSS
mmetsp:Transcript_22300/g.71291  ORF Transcript_22300/g.71291 Transcript_22300/m.71291 type:complete len:434 (+) Transcript_22300:185-1486(+)